MSEENPRPKNKEKPPSIFLPILLIAVGVYFLLVNLGTLPGNFWTTLWRLWPVLLIAGGLEGIIRRYNMVTSAFFAATGTVFLLCNFDYLPYSILTLVIYLWPLLLVAIGFDVLIGKRSIWFSLVGMLAMLVIFAAAVLYIGGGVTLAGGTPVTDISQPLDGAEKAVFDLEVAAGVVTVDPLESNDLLIEGSVPSSDDFEVLQSYSVSDGIGNYHLHTEGDFAFMPGVDQNDYRWLFRINDTIPSELNFNLGAGDATLTLTYLAVESFSMELGAGQGTIYLPEMEGFTAQVDMGLGTVTIYVPQGLGIQIITETGLTAVTVPDGYQKDGNRYVSPSYAGSSNPAELRINNPIGTVVIEEK